MISDATYTPLFTPGMDLLSIRQLTAREELAVQDTSAATCISLISTLVRNDSQQSLHAGNLVTADIDRMLALVYCENYGLQIRGRLQCDNCETGFDIDFLLPALEEFMNAESKYAVVETGEYEWEGHRFRLPTGDDELAISGLSEEAAINLLLQRCTLNEGVIDRAGLEDQLAGIAPLLQKEITGHCPECGTENNTLFDIRFFLMNKMLQEQKMVFHEVHLLASIYKWSHDEILRLPRSWRRKYVNCIKEDVNLL